MRAIRSTGDGIVLDPDAPEPVARSGETIVRVKKAGICDTDLQLARGYMNFKGVLGHEFVGIDDRGRRVVAEINNSCHACATCSEAPSHCPNRTVLGILNHDGAMADRVAVPERNLHVVPNAIDDASAVFIEPLAAAFRIGEQIELAGARLAVVGDGKLGILCAWASRLCGAEVTLIGKHRDKLALAGDGIAAHLLDDSPRFARSFDIVVEASGSPSGLATAFGLAKPLGTIVLKTTVAGTHETSLAPIVIDEYRVIGSRCGPFPKAMDALASGRIDVHPLIEAEYPLDRGEEAFAAAARKGARKILLSVSS